MGIAGPIVAKSYSLQQAVKMSRYGSLININPFVKEEHEIGGLHKRSQLCCLNSADK